MPQCLSLSLSLFFSCSLPLCVSTGDCLGFKMVYPPSYCPPNLSIPSPLGFPSHFIPILFPLLSLSIILLSLPFLPFSNHLSPLDVFQSWSSSSIFHCTPFPPHDVTIPSLHLFATFLSFLACPALSGEWMGGLLSDHFSREILLQTSRLSLPLSLSLPPHTPTTLPSPRKLGRIGDTPPLPKKGREEWKGSEGSGQSKGSYKCKGGQGWREGIQGMVGMERGEGKGSKGWKRWKG